jgi:hypothetical protein
MFQNVLFSTLKVLPVSKSPNLVPGVADLSLLRNLSNRDIVDLYKTIFYKNCDSRYFETNWDNNLQFYASLYVCFCTLNAQNRLLNMGSFFINYSISEKNVATYNSLIICSKTTNLF